MTLNLKSISSSDWLDPVVTTNTTLFRRITRKLNSGIRAIRSTLGVGSIKSLKGFYTGQTVLLLGNGPSQSDIDYSLVKDLQNSTEFKIFAINQFTENTNLLSCDINFCLFSAPASFCANISESITASRIKNCAIGYVLTVILFFTLIVFLIPWKVCSLRIHSSILLMILSIVFHYIEEYRLCIPANTVL